MLKIPFDRQILYLIILGVLPLFFVASHYFSKQEELSLVSSRLQRIQFESQKYNLECWQTKLTKKEYTTKEKDRFYVEHFVENIPLLTSEISQLKKLSQHGLYLDENAIKQRFNFLTNGHNGISFIQNPQKSFPGIQETILTLSHPVEVNNADLYTILSRVEGVPLGENKPSNARIHLIILEARLEKKKELLGEVYSLYMKLLKREYVQ